MDDDDYDGARWDGFLQSTAISYAPPPIARRRRQISSSSSSPSSSGRRGYWDPDLLGRWRSLCPDAGGGGSSDDGGGGRGISRINYGSYLLLASSIAEALCRRLSLVAVELSDPRASSSAERVNEYDNDDDGRGSSSPPHLRRRVGIALPEGPFLPLFVLAVHSLNVMIVEGCIMASSSAVTDETTNSGIDCDYDHHDDDDEREDVGQIDEGKPTSAREKNTMRRGSDTIAGRGKCDWDGVAMVPLEIDEAPERLRHMLADSRPDMIILAANSSSGGGPAHAMGGMADVVRTMVRNDDKRGDDDDDGDSSSPPSTIQLVDYATLVEEALDSLRRANARVSRDDEASLVEWLWPPRTSERRCCSSVPPHDEAVPRDSSSFDVAKLVAMGSIRLLSSLSVTSSSSSLSVHDEPLPSPSPRHRTRFRRSARFDRDIVSHVVYTSGTTGVPKGCVSSLGSLRHYLHAKNLAHGIDDTSRVLLASALTFDPCLSDVLATCMANATLCMASRARMYGRGEDCDCDDDDDDEGDEVRGNYDDDMRERPHAGGLTGVLRQLDVTHVLCTPALWSTVDGHPTVNDYPSLRVVALGGEPISRSMLGRWARHRRTGWEEGQDHDGGWDRSHPRLCATYGTTEACVYQTFGEVFVIVEEEGGRSSTSSDDGVGCGVGGGGGTTPSSVSLGTNVGLPLLGTNICICRPYPEDDGDENADNERFEAPALDLVERDAGSSGPTIGEVVISGAQVDSISSYLNSAKLTDRVFSRGPVEGICSRNGDPYYYRTGDMGYVDPTTGDLRILGRIKGDGMVKINGMRIELSEIENACIDDANDEEGRLVVDCIAAVDGTSDSSDDTAHRHKQLIAYCLLSSTSLSELEIDFEQLISVYPEPKLSLIPSTASRSTSGVIVAPGPLLSLLRARCDRRVRRGCTPSFFVIIDRLPLSSTGKRNRLMLPPLSACSIMTSSANSNENRSLWKCGIVGSNVANKICECLNIQQCQRQLVTLDANFFALGGDSLAATRVVRGLHAKHHGVMDSRNLGGGTGTLDGLFAAKYLLKSETLGAYIEFLASKSAFQTIDDTITVGTEGEEIGVNSTPGYNLKENVTDPLYVSLLESITLGYTRVACSLLDLGGVDPNTQSCQGRLGKVSDRQQRRSVFMSGPLHLACLRGDPYLVRKLLEKGCKANTPDASGSFPIHLACSRIEAKIDDVEEDLKRLECVKLLLNAGKTPISIKDGNKQTILHSAARSGHCNLLVYIMNQWKLAAETIGIKFEHINAGGDFDWRDRWYRTPVHWAILNQRVAALRILLDGGCSAFPRKPKSGVSTRTTGVTIETPLELCQRLYFDTPAPSPVIGEKIRRLLTNAKF